MTDSIYIAQKVDILLWQSLFNGLPPGQLWGSPGPWTPLTPATALHLASLTMVL